MINSVTYEIFNSIYFLNNELNQITQYNNILYMDREKQKIIDLVISPNIDCLIVDDLLQESVTTEFPLVRKDYISFNYDNNENNKELHDYIVYFVNGYKHNKIYNNKNTTLFYKTFIDSTSKYGTIVILEDTINDILKEIHSSFDDNFNLIIEMSESERKRIRIQNYLIMDIINLYTLFFEKHLKRYEYTYTLFPIFDLSIGSNRKENEYYDNIYSLLAWCAIKEYLKIIYPDCIVNKDKLNNIFKHLICTFLYKFITTDKTPKFILKLEKRINEYIKYWSSPEFQSLEFAYKCNNCVLNI